MSKIILCCPFYNENLVANIHVKEASKWVDEIHVTECNKSFKYGPHSFCFKLEEENPKVHYHQLDGSKYYLHPRNKSIITLPHLLIKPVSKWMKHYCYETAWYNEGVSRNHALWNIDYKDDDILILSDIDEIIDSRYSEEILTAVKEYGIITVKIYFTMFYFNLFCKKWSGPDGYSYRIFCVRGDVLRNKYYNDSDFLRKQGEQSQLSNKVKCLEGYKGYHHSWLGDEHFVANKIMSYAHDVKCHKNGLLNDRGEPDVIAIKEMLKKGDSLFENNPLEIDNTIALLPDIEKLRREDTIHFI